jgi:hypothetical protein
MRAMLRLRMHPWPFAGPAVIVEQDAACTRTELHLVDAWRYLGSARTEAELHELVRTGGSLPRREAPHVRASSGLRTAREEQWACGPSSLPTFDVDVYRLLTRALHDDRRFRVVDLSAARAS